MKRFPVLFLFVILTAILLAACSGGGGGGSVPSPSGITSWVFVDGNGTNGINKDATKNAYSPQLTVLGSKLYAIWDEGSTASQIRVAVYNGNDASPSWTFVDGNGTNGINRNAANTAFAPQPAVLGIKLYAAWLEYNGSAYQIRVAVYSGNDISPSWAFVDGNGANGINKDATKSASSLQLTVSGSKLYATWVEPNSTASQIRVAVYNGNDASPSWTFVDKGVNGINKDNSKNAYGPQFAASGSKLYATWVEPNSTTSQIRVTVYNGDDISPSWTFVDGNGTNGINKDVARSAGSPQMTVSGSKLYATWTEDNSITQQVRVAVYNGNDLSPSWTFVDGNGPNGINKDPMKSAGGAQLTALGTKLYAIWPEAGQIRVAVGQ